MSNPRDVVVEHLTAELPDVLVKPHADQVDNVVGDLVMVRLDTVVPGVVKGRRDYTGSLLLVTGATSAEAGDGDVDDLLEDVLAVLDKTPNVTWSEAKRATLDDQWHAWEVTVRYPIVPSVPEPPTP
jgi:hypothetical protein